MDSATLATLTVIVAVAALSPVLADRLKRFHLPAVVLELLIGIALGASGWFTVDPVISSFSSLGLALLMFLAGYELDFGRMRGAPLRLGGAGWLVSLGLGLAAGWAMHARGAVVSGLIVGLALTTTALGTMLPMWRDAGLLGTRFGAHALAVGTFGEFGPIVAVALLLSGHQPGVASVLLVAFAVVALVTAWLAAQPTPPGLVRLYRENLHNSSQFPVRVTVVLIIALLWVAEEMGLDVLLGAFTAGIVVRLGSHGEHAAVLRIKLEAIGFGFLIPIFFVVSGMQFDLTSLVENPAAALRIPLYLALFLAVRGLPALLYRGELPRGQLWPLALFSGTALPLVVAITQIGVSTDRMRPETAAALVAAAMLSVVVYPLVSFALLRKRGVAAAPGTATPDLDEPV